MVFTPKNWKSQDREPPRLVICLLLIQLLPTKKTQKLPQTIPILMIPVAFVKNNYVQQHSDIAKIIVGTPVRNSTHQMLQIVGICQNFP